MYSLAIASLMPTSIHVVDIHSPGFRCLQHYDVNGAYRNLSQLRPNATDLCSPWLGYEMVGPLRFRITFWFSITLLIVLVLGIFRHGNVALAAGQAD